MCSIMNQIVEYIVPRIDNIGWDLLVPLKGNLSMLIGLPKDYSFVPCP